MRRRILPATATAKCDDEKDSNAEMKKNMAAAK
jgi:hypothetical protein